MTSRRPDHAASAVEDDETSPATGGAEREHAEHASTFYSVNQDVLFADNDERCDVCGATCADDEGDGFAVPGRGEYRWARGSEVRIEEPKLCPECAVAVGVSALARWEIEEEEG